MPIKDDEKRRAWFREYRKKKHPEIRESEAERKIRWYQENLAERRKLNAKANRAACDKPRKKGPKSKPEIPVSASKKYRYINGTIYWTSKRGFTVKEVREILRLVTQEDGKKGKE